MSSANIRATLLAAKSLQIRPGPDSQMDTRVHVQDNGPDCTSRDLSHASHRRATVTTLMQDVFFA